MYENRVKTCAKTGIRSCYEHPQESKYENLYENVREDRQENLL